MSHVTSLGFEMLDRHVVHGRGDQIACSDATGSLTFVKLTEQVAELAGGLRMLGVEPGASVRVSLPPGNTLVMAVCAVIRLGALPCEGPDEGPDTEGEVRIVEVDGEAWVRAGDHQLELTTLRRAGRSEPAPSLTHDPAVDHAEAFADIVQTLLSGSPVV